MAQSIPAKSPGAEIICHDPATGGEIGRAPLFMPEEVARAIVWLLSDEASYMTGALVDVTGGR